MQKDSIIPNTHPKTPKNSKPANYPPMNTVPAGELPKKPIPATNNIRNRTTNE